MRMRTLDGALVEIREADTNTAITRNALRCAILSGKIPSVKSGKKYLIDMDTLPLYFTAAPALAPVTNGITPVAE